MARWPRWLALAVAARAARHHHATPRFADADAVVRPAAGGSGPTPRFFFVLGVEGTGHHFWTELGAKLNGGELDRLPEEARRRVDGVLTEVTSCFFSLSQPRTPRPCSSLAGSTAPRSSGREGRCSLHSWPTSPNAPRCGRSPRWLPS